MQDSNGATAPEWPSLRTGRAHFRGKLVALFILGFPVVLFALAGLHAVQLAREGEVPAELRDLDCDGRVSFAEWLRGGIDFRIRESASHPGCREIYAAKSGATFVLRCPSPPRCRLARNVDR